MEVVQCQNEQLTNSFKELKTKSLICKEREDKESSFTPKDVGFFKPICSNVQASV